MKIPVYHEKFQLISCVLLCILKWSPSSHNIYSCMCATFIDFRTCVWWCDATGQLHRTFSRLTLHKIMQSLLSSSSFCTTIYAWDDEKSKVIFNIYTQISICGRRLSEWTTPFNGELPYMVIREDQLRITWSQTTTKKKRCFVIINQYIEWDSSVFFSWVTSIVIYRNF